MVQDDDDEAWEWVHTPSRLYNLHTTAVSDDDDEMFCFREDAGPPAGLLSLTTNITQKSESLSSSASSPILKHGLAVTVMAKEHISALDSLHHSDSEWIEPQLVFSKQQGLHFEGYEVYEVVMYLQNLPKAKEALVSLLSDPVVCDAVIRNEAFRQLTFNEKESNFGSKRSDLNSVCTTSSFYKQGKNAYKLLKEKLTTAIDIVLSLLGSPALERNAVDQLDTTVRSCILLVALLVFTVIGKRSN